MKKISCLILALIFIFGAGVAQAQDVLAFPGAEGFGRYALGARGVASPSVYHVTNLDDSGTGSLRDAISQPGRIVVFDVCGVIKIKSRLIFSANSYIAGQTAPGDGIIVYGDGSSFSGANNLIIRHMRFYMGKQTGSAGKDATGIANGKDMMFDHLSVAWGLDENFSVNWDGKGTEPTNITIQNSIIGQGIMTHSAGGLIQTIGGVSILNNLYIDNVTRNPKVKGLNQFINNVVYNWGGSDGYILGGDSEGPSWGWLEGNYFISGPNSGSSPFTRANSNFQVYHQGNYIDNNKDGSLNGVVAVNDNYGPATFRADRASFTNIPKAHPDIAGGILSAQDALTRVIASAGASLPARSAVDTYVVNELLSYGTKGALITNEKQNGIYNFVGVVSEGKKAADSDGDGIPDEWEVSNDLNPNSATDAIQVAANGYLNIENYINSINAPIKPYVRCASDIKMTARTKNSISLSWVNNALESDNVLLQQSSNGTTFTTIQTLAADATSYTVSALTVETPYYYRIITTKSELDDSTPSEILKVSTEGEPSVPYPSHTPVPAVGETSRFYTSFDFAWQNETGPWAGDVTYDIYFGVSAESLTKLNAAPLTEMAYIYTATKTMEQTYYWRVDATNALGTTAGTVWSFKAGTYSFTTSYVDVGKDFDGLNTVNAGTLLVNGTKTYTPQSGTNNEMTFVASGGATVSSSDGSYMAKGTPVVQYFDLTNAAYYVEVSLTDKSASKNIAAVKINGTGSDVDPDKGSAYPVIVFSDKRPFDGNSVIGYEQVYLPYARGGYTGATVTAAVGTKTFRIYRNVTIGSAGEEERYKIGGTTDPLTFSTNNVRLAYVGVTLELLSNDAEGGGVEKSTNNKIQSLTINGVNATINHAAGTITCQLPRSTGAMRAFPVAFVLDDTKATANFTSGNSHNFASNLSLEITAEDGSKKVYTISATIATKKQLGMLTVDGAKASYDDLLVSAFTDFDITYLNAGGTVPANIETYYQDFDLIVIHANVGGTNAIGLATRNMVGKKPILSLKAFLYQDGRWGWTTAASGNAGIGEVKATVAAAVQNHPIYSGVTFSGEELTYYSAPTTVTNGIQYATAFGGTNWSMALDTVNHTLASFGTGAQMHEVNLNNAAKYIMLGLSMEGTPSCYTLFNENTVTLLRNTAAYLTNSSAWYNFKTNTPQEEAAPKSEVNTIASLTVNGVAAQINSATGAITCELPNSVGALGSFAVAFVLDDTKATANFTSGSSHNFAGAALQIQVTAENGDKKTYTVTATVAAPLSSVNTIASLTVRGVAAQINQATGAITCELPSSVPALGPFAVVFSLTDTKATTSFASGNSYNFSMGSLQIEVTAENGDKKVYTVTVTIETPAVPSEVNTIATLTVNGVVAQIDQAWGEIACELPHATGALGSFVVEFTLGNGGATTDFVSGSSHNFADGNLQIEVTAENGDTRTYTIMVSIASATGVEQHAVMQLKYSNGIVYNPNGVKVTVYTTHGVEVLRSENTDIDVRQLPKGIYFAKPQKGKALKFAN